MESKRQSLHQGAYTLLVTAIITKIIGALFKIPLSSDYCLGDIGFGYFSAAYDFYTPIYVLAISGFPVAISKIIADFAANGERENVFKTFCTARNILFKIAIIGTVILCVVAYPLSVLIDNTGMTFLPLLATVPAFFFCCVSSIYRGYYEGISNMFPTAVSNIIEAVCKLILGFSFALLTVKLSGNPAFGATGAILGITVGTVLSAFYLAQSFKNDMKSTGNGKYLTKKPDTVFSKTVWVMTVTVALSSLVGSFVALVDTVTVRWQLASYSNEAKSIFTAFYDDVFYAYQGTKCDVSAELLPTFLYGIRSKAYTLFNLVPTLTVALGVSLIPSVTSAYVKGERQELDFNISTVIKLVSIISLPVGFGFIALNTRIMTFLYGYKVSSFIGGKMLAVYGLATVFSGITVAQICVLQAINRHFSALRNVAVGIAVKILLNLSLGAIPSLNIWASVIATVICYTVVFALNTLSIGFSLDTFNHMNSYLKPFISAIVCGVTAFLVSLIGNGKTVTFAAIVIAGAVYFAALFFFRTFTDDDILALPYGKKVLNVLKNTKIM